MLILVQKAEVIYFFLIVIPSLDMVGILEDLQCRRIFPPKKFEFLNFSSINSYQMASEFFKCSDQNLPEFRLKTNLHQR